MLEVLLGCHDELPRKALGVVRDFVDFVDTSLDRNPSQISSIIGKTPRDRIGDRMARRIEAVSGKDIGWLDQARDPGARNKYTDIDFLERVIQIMAENVGDMGLPPRKLAYIIYNASLLRDQFQDSDLDELQIHIKELLSLALEN